MRTLINSLVFSFLIGCAVYAQSPHTASLSVVVVDQTGAVVPEAKVSVINPQTGLSREASTGSDGSATIVALPLAGEYEAVVSRAQFADEHVRNIRLRAGETATLRVKLLATGGESQVTVYGTADGIRQDPQLGQRLDSQTIDETPVLGRKITSLPLLSSAFRQAKGTGDLFVNATFFVTGVGGRRQPAVTLDGASNDDPWGRQTMLATVPVGAVQEMSVLSHAFSAEFGWTSSAAVNIVTKTGTNALHGEALFLGRPGGMQSRSLGTDAQCPGSIPSCAPPTSGGAAVEILSPDIPDQLAQTSFDAGGPLVKNKTFFFGAFDYTHQDRTAPITTPLVPSGTQIVGKYRQVLADGRIDHQISTPHRLMVRANLDRFYDTNPQDVVSGNVLPSAGRKFTRHTFSMQANETAVIGSFLNEARVSYLHGDPITRFEPVQPSTQFTRAGVAPFTAGESRSVDVYSRVAQFSDTLSLTKGAHYLRAGAGVARSVSGGDGTEFGSAFVLGQYTVLATSTRPPDQLTLADMQRYQQSFTFGKSTYELSQWLITGFVQDSYRVHPHATIDLGVRYDRQTFSDATTNFAPRVGFAWNPGGDPRTAIRGGYGVYYTQLRANLAAGFELGGPEGIFTYQASPGQTGFPTCLEYTPVPFDPAAAAPTLPARNVTIRPGQRDYYATLIPGFSAIPDCPDGEYSLNGRPCYPSELVNPSSQVASIGVEREIMPRLFLTADYVHQHASNLDRSADLNAPSYFERTAPGQSRSTAAADATRPITPVNGGYRAINVTENLGLADYDGLQTALSFRGHRRLQASVSYTLSKATNTTEPDGNGIGPNDNNRLGEDERGPSLLDQRHRAVFSLTCNLPYNITAGTVTQLASARPVNATTGADNNGDGANNDRALIDGRVVGKSSFRGTRTSDVSVFAETRLPLASHALLLRVEAFNLFDHANVLGRNGVYGNTATPLPTFGQATPGLAATDAARMVQFQVRYLF